MRAVHIIGAGGHGRVVFDVIRAGEPDRPVRWHDDAWKVMKPVGPVEDVEPVEVLFGVETGVDCVVAIGACTLRLSLLKRLLEYGHRSPPLVHPSAWVSPHTGLGPGTVVMAGAVIQTGAMLGQGVIVNTSSTIDHDCDLADGVHVAPGARLAGGVHVGEASMIGIGAVIREGVCVGEGSIVGAGAVVVKDVADGKVVAGNPAAPLKSSRGGSR